MWKILRHYGLPEKILNIIKCLYDGSTSAVRIDGILSKEFSITTGVLQGDTLAPFLFIIVLDYVLQNTEATTGLETHPNERLPDLDFADDIVLLDQSEIEAIQHFQTIEVAAKKVGLSINYEKTKVMIRNITNTRTEVKEGKTVIKVAENKYLDIVDDFKYLGAYIANCHLDFKKRKGLAWCQFWKLTTIWKSNELSLIVKLHLFGSIILSILFYNSETWVTTKIMKKEIDSFGTSCYRYMLGIKRIDRVRNEEILQKVRRSNLSNFMYKRQLRSLGHWIRKDDIIRPFALYKNSNGKNRLGRPRLNFNKHIEKITESTTEELIRKAQNRQEWRRDVVGRFDLQPPD